MQENLARQEDEDYGKVERDSFPRCLDELELFLVIKLLSNGRLPSTGRRSEAFSQEIVPIHQGNSSRERVSLDLALVLIFLPGEIFLHLAFGAYARGGLCVVRLLYHPTGAREGGDPRPGVRHHASCPGLLRAVPDPYHAWGRGRMGDGGRVEEDRGLLGIQVIPRAGSVGGSGADRNGHIPSKK